MYRLAEIVSNFICYHIDHALQQRNHLTIHLNNNHVVPAISQHYIVPNPSNTIGLARDMRNNNAVFSLWSYFLEFLATDPASMIRVPSWSIPPVADEKVNKHTGRKRLDLFIAMSEGKSAESCA